MGKWTFGALGVLLACTACGGEKKEPDFPPNPPADTREETPDDSWVTEDATATEPEPEPEAEAPKELKEPEFKDGMSVEEAISAVPSHYDYIGLDQEVLAKPLTDPETFKECKLTPNDHFNVRLAIWMGKVVGADVKAATPAKTECIDRAVRAIEYKEQVESINTVEYAL